MSKNVVRIIVSPTKFWVGSLLSALEIACQHYRQLQCGGHIILFAPFKDLKHGLLETAIGAKPLAALLKSQPMTINGCPVRLETPRTIKTSLKEKIVVVLFAGDSFIGALDALRSPQVVIAAPEFMEEISGWARKWKPIEEPSRYEDSQSLQNR